MIHPDTELRFIDDKMGYGVFATKRIPQGTITWALDSFDMEFTTDEVSAMDPIHLAILDKYSYRNSKGHYVLCWDFGRFVNHSFNSSCISTGYDFEIATRDIEPGEELTDDYGFLNLKEPFEARDENSDRKYVYPDDLATYYKIWDAQIALLFPLILKVEQPLMPIIHKDVQREIQETISGHRAMKSILSHYCQDSAVTV